MKSSVSMGIPQLNQYLQHNSKNGIREISLNDLRGKVLVIDTSIYLYKYLSEGILVEGFYHLITKLRQFNIVPLFVFDGKPPPEKQNEICERKQRKDEARREYNDLLSKFENEQNTRKRLALKTSLDNLKRQFVRVTYEDIYTIKSLIQAYGVSYAEADGEADALCAAIVNSDKAYACLSEDMDMFVYGCKRVLRYLSLLNSSVVIYDTDVILHDLGMTYEEFRDVCIITGCDYVKKHQRSLQATMDLFTKYRMTRQYEESFHKWITYNTDYLSDHIEFENISELFSLKDCYNDFVENVQVFNSAPNVKNLTQILSNNGFIFV